MKWQEVDEKHWWYCLEVLPPAIWLSYGFMVGEPMDHAKCTITGDVRARYSALVEKDGKRYECARPLTIPEFRALDLSTVQ